MDVHRKFTFDDPEDSYWNESANASIFDDFQNASIARQALDDLFERTDSYTVDDNASVTESEKPKSELEVEFINRMATVSITSKPIRRNTATSDAQSVSDMSVSDSRKNTISNGLAPEKFFFQISNASMVSECSVGSFSSEITVHMDYARLRSEHRKLQKHLEKVRQDRYRPLEVHDAIKRLRTCQPVALDFYRSKQQKMDLLDEALQCRNRDVIVTVILFLKRTLSNSVFREILILKPAALEYYVSYLRETGDSDELMNTLFAMGRTDEAAMVEFTVASRKRQPDAKIQALKKCLISGLSDPTLSDESKFVDEYINLLEWQIPIDAKDEDACKAGTSEIFKQFPKKASLICQPLFTTLYYCCLYHYDLSMNSYASPWYVRTVFNINEKVFTWMAISALSRQKRYTEIEKLLTSKKLLTGYKMVCPFPWNAFFFLIFKYGVPPKEVLTKWLHAVGDLDERLKICEQFGEAPDVHVETLIAMRDKTRLSNLLKKLNPHSIEYNKAHLALSNTAYKWRN